MTNSNGPAVSLSAYQSDTQILKKPSPQFMVNDPDPIDSVTGQQASSTRPRRRSPWTLTGSSW